MKRQALATLALLATTLGPRGAVAASALGQPLLARAVVHLAADSRYAVVPAWRVADPSAVLVLQTSSLPEGSSALVAEVYREHASSRTAMTLPVRPTEDGDLELAVGPEGLPLGRYTIAVFDAEQRYGWPLAEYRLDVQ